MELLVDINSTNCSLSCYYNKCFSHSRKIYNFNNMTCPSESNICPDTTVVVGILVGLLCLTILAIIFIIICFLRKIRKFEKQENKVSITPPRERNVVNPRESEAPAVKPKMRIIEERGRDNPINEYDSLPSKLNRKPPTPPNVRKQKEEMFRPISGKDDNYLAMGSATYYKNFHKKDDDDVYGNVEEDDIYINN